MFWVLFKTIFITSREKDDEVRVRFEKSTYFKYMREKYPDVGVQVSEDEAFIVDYSESAYKDMMRLKVESPSPLDLEYAFQDKPAAEELAGILFPSGGRNSPELYGVRLCLERVKSTHDYTVRMLEMLVFVIHTEERLDLERKLNDYERVMVKVCRGLEALEGSLLETGEVGVGGINFLQTSPSTIARWMDEAKQTLYEITTARQSSPQGSAVLIQKTGAWAERLRKISADLQDLSL